MIEKGSSWSWVPCDAPERAPAPGGSLGVLGSVRMCCARMAPAETPHGVHFGVQYEAST